MSTQTQLMHTATFSKNIDLAKDLHSIWLLANNWQEFKELLDSPEHRDLKLRVFNSVGMIPTMYDNLILMDEDTSVNLEHYRYNLHVKYLDGLKAKYGDQVVHVDKKVKNAVYIGRGRGGRMGNPYSYISSIKGTIFVDSRVEACMAYKLYIQEVMKTNSNMVLLQNIKATKGHTVACWCNGSGSDTSIENPNALDHYCHGLIILATADVLNK